MIVVGGGGAQILAKLRAVGSEIQISSSPARTLLGLGPTLLKLAKFSAGEDI